MSQFPSQNFGGSCSCSPHVHPSISFSQILYARPLMLSWEFLPKLFTLVPSCQIIFGHFQYDLLPIYKSRVDPGRSCLVELCMSFDLKMVDRGAWLRQVWWPCGSCDLRVYFQPYSLLLLHGSHHLHLGLDASPSKMIFVWRFPCSTHVFFTYQSLIVGHFWVIQA